LEETYRLKKLPYASEKCYKNEFERKFYWILGLVRDDPPMLITHIKDFVGSPLYNAGLENPMAIKILI